MNSSEDVFNESLEELFSHSGKKKQNSRSLS